MKFHFYKWYKTYVTVSRCKYFDHSNPRNRLILTLSIVITDSNL